MAIRITHIRLSGGNQHEHITHLWWINPTTGVTGDSTKATIVNWIENDKGVAFVQQPSTPRADVGVVAPTHGEKYLRTYADKQWNNNLLSLPRR